MRARIKNLEDQPSELLCCEYVRGEVKEQQGRIIEVVEGSVRRLSWLCGSCGAGGDTEPHYRTLDFPGVTWIPVAALDLQEGTQ